jgi:hypothetical protein
MLKLFEFISEFPVLNNREFEIHNREIYFGIREMIPPDQGTSISLQEHRLLLSPVYRDRHF